MSKFHIIRILVVCAAISLAAATLGGVETAKADTVATGIPAATANDTQLECAMGGSFAIEYPSYASPARWSYFVYRLNGGAWQTYPYYFYFDGTRDYYLGGNGWNRIDPSYHGFSLDVGGATVEAFERRYDANGSSWVWVDLGSCNTTRWLGGFDFNYGTP
jgi:hypothetical protein